METKIPLKDIVDAAIKNGFNLSRKGWFGFREGYSNPNSPIYSACFMGQAALNLGVTTSYINNAFFKLKVTRKALLKTKSKRIKEGVNVGEFLNNVIVWLNDDTRVPYETIAQFVQDVYDTSPEEIKSLMVPIYRTEYIISPGARKAAK